MDPGEEEFETALRETKEEAGLSREQLHVYDGFKKVLMYNVKGRPKKVVYWLSELKDPHTPITLSDEHQAYEWLNFESTLELCQIPRLAGALDRSRQLHKDTVQGTGRLV